MQNVKELSKNEEGFTLVEVLAALAIISTIIILLISITGFTTKSITSGENRMEALEIAERELTIQLENSETDGMITEQTRVDGIYQIQIITSDLEEDIYRPNTTNIVSLQGTWLKSSGKAIPEQKLVTIIVSWGGAD